MSATAVRQGSAAAQRGRNLVMWALTPYRHQSAGISPTAAFSGRGRHQVAIGGRTQGKSSAFEKAIQEAGFSPTLIYAKDTSQAKYSRPLDGGEGMLSHDQVLRVISELQPIEQTWIHHRYREYGELKELCTRRFATLMWKAYQHLHLLRTRQRTKSVAQHLVQLQVMYSAYPLFWPEDRPAEIADLIRHGELTEATWKKTYAPHWRAIRALMVEIDERACANVARKI